MVCAGLHQVILYPNTEEILNPFRPTCNGHETLVSPARHALPHEVVGRGHQNTGGIFRYLGQAAIAEPRFDGNLEAEMKTEKTVVVNVVLPVTLK